MDERGERRWQFRGVRYVFTLLGFLGFCTLYALRVNLNVAIVAMVNATAESDGHNQSKSEECPADLPPIYGNGTSDRPHSEEGEFTWSPSLQAVILGAFYYGYCISQIPGGRLAELLGAKGVFGLGTLVPALLTLLTPLAARSHVGLLIAVRALEGLAQGMTMPAMHSLLGRWLPDGERGTLSTIVYVGINVGTVVGMPLAALLCDGDILGGWPAAFYLFGLFGVVWFIAWCLLMTDSPHDHPFITKSELKYINMNQNVEHNVTLPPFPWCRVLTSVPFCALLLAQVGQDWCFYTLLNDLPTYFNNILHFKVQKNGFMSSIPHLLQTVVGITVGYVADACVRRNFVTVGFVRKFCNTIACIGTAAGLFGVCAAGCDVTVHVVSFMLAFTLGGFCYSGYMLSHLDLSPEYAGTLMGICNTISNLTGFLAPLLVGALTEDAQTLHQWHIVFYITAAIVLATGLVFLLFSSAKKQPWASDYQNLEPKEAAVSLSVQAEYGTL